MISDKLPPDCYDVYRWPEFQALCERLGIPMDLRTTAITIRLPGEGKLVEIIHEYQGQHFDPVDKPKIIDTTCLLNEQFRTFRPPAKKETAQEQLAESFQQARAAAQKGFSGD